MFALDPFVSMEVPSAKGWGASLASFLHEPWDNLISPVSLRKKKTVLGPSLHHQRAGFVLSHKGFTDCSLKSTCRALDRQIAKHHANK